DRGHQDAARRVELFLASIGVPAPPSPFRRAIVIVLDSVGIGELPDADAYGDRGSNTVGNVARHVSLQIPTLRALGLERLVPLGAASAAKPAPTRVPCAAGRMAEISPGKDSVTGHWE